MSVSNQLRGEVLRCFKKLHRARIDVFNGDPRALQAAREKINSEFQKSREETDESKIKNLIKFGLEAEELLRKTVVQTREVAPGRYKMRITKDTNLEQNYPYNYKGNIS